MGKCDGSRRSRLSRLSETPMSSSETPSKAFVSQCITLIQCTVGQPGALATDNGCQRRSVNCFSKTEDPFSLGSEQDTKIDY